MCYRVTLRVTREETYYVYAEDLNDAVSIASEAARYGSDEYGPERSLVDVRPIAVVEVD